MTTEAIWVLARASGTASLIALAVSLLSGMALRSGVLGRLARNRAVSELHTFSNALWLPLGLVHVIALLFDPYAQIRVLDLFVPFAVPYARIAIGLGTVSFLLLALVLVTTLMRRSLPQDLWLSIHQLAYPAFVAAFAHSVLSGTDLASPPIAALMWMTALALGWAWTKRVASMYRTPRRGMASITAIALFLVVPLLAIACGGSGLATPSAASSSATAATSAASAAPTTAASAAASSGQTAGGAPALQVTCTSPATPTVEMTEGPYYKANPPQKSVLAPAGMSGTRIVVSGFVLTTQCQPVANAKVDVWQADASGNYDNSGYTLRGYVLTDAQGRYSFETIVPGLYPGRTEHIHIKVWGSSSTLTTQLYFPGVSQNTQDSIYNSANLLRITEGSPLQGRFDFILARP